jgi:hypothetical protein
MEAFVGLEEGATRPTALFEMPVVRDQTVKIVTGPAL